MGAAGAGVSAGLSLIGAAFADSDGATVSFIDVDVSGIDIQADDLLIGVCGHGAGGAGQGVDPPSGWTSRASGGTAMDLEFAYKQAAGTETTVTWPETPGASNNHMGAIVAVVRGVDFSGGPMGGTAGEVNATATSGDPASYTPAVADEFVFVAWVVNSPSSTYPTDAGGPTDFIVLFNRENSGGGVSVGLAYKVHTTGAIDPDEVVWGGAVEEHYIVTQGVRPA